MQEDLSGRVALVTGAARGIGLATARALAHAGACVALVDTDERALETAVSSLGETRGLTTISDRGRIAGGLAIKADVSRAADARRAVAMAVERFEELHILVNNAGVCPLTPFADIGEDEWDRVLAVNLKGAFLFCQAALPHIRQAGRHGRIVNVSSAAGQMGGVAVGAHYSAAKAGLIGLTKMLARLLARDGATANCVAPGTTATDMTTGWPEETQAQVRAGIPLGRFAQPGEIAGAICYLASDRAAFITGATLDVNGGLYLR